MYRDEIYWHAEYLSTAAEYSTFLNYLIVFLVHCNTCASIVVS